MGPAAQEGQRTKWNKMTYDQRIKALMDMIQELNHTVQRDRNIINDFPRHTHDKDGKPVIINRVGDGEISNYPDSPGGLVPTVASQGRGNVSRMFEQFDFSDDEQSY